MDSPHLGAIVSANSLNWYMYFNRDKLGLIVDFHDFAVVYTQTSVEVGECITAKLLSVDFSSSKVSTTCLATSQLVVALSLYGVLLVVLVVMYSRYSRYSILGTVV